MSPEIASAENSYDIAHTKALIAKDKLQKAEYEFLNLNTEFEKNARDPRVGNDAVQKEKKKLFKAARGVEELRDEFREAELELGKKRIELEKEDSETRKKAEVEAEMVDAIVTKRKAEREQEIAEIKTKKQVKPLRETLKKKLKKFEFVPKSQDPKSETNAELAKVGKIRNEPKHYRSNEERKQFKKEQREAAQKQAEDKRKEKRKAAQRKAEKEAEEEADKAIKELERREAEVDRELAEVEEESEEGAEEESEAEESEESEEYKEKAKVLRKKATKKFEEIVAAVNCDNRSSNAIRKFIKGSRGVKLSNIEYALDRLYAENINDRDWKLTLDSVRKELRVIKAEDADKEAHKK